MREKKTKQTDKTEWIKETLANFENLYPGLVEKITAISSQNQVRLSMYPQPPAGGASSTTGELS